MLNTNESLDAAILNLIKKGYRQANIMLAQIRAVMPTNADKPKLIENSLRRLKKKGLACYKGSKDGWYLAAKE